MDWGTASALATAGGTLVLAAATFASIRSANRSARAAERSMLAGLRPLLMPSRPEDPTQKVGFADQKWVHLAGGGGVVESTDGVVYLAIALRNVGTGIAVLDGWQFAPGRVRAGEAGMPDIDGFRRLSRDLYIPVGDNGFWQGTFRDSSEPDFARAKAVAEEREGMTIDLLYGDYEGGQRMISRFFLEPRADEGWIVTVARHWHVDRPNPR